MSSFFFRTPLHPLGIIIEFALIWKSAGYFVVFRKWPCTNIELTLHKSTHCLIVFHKEFYNTSLTHIISVVSGKKLKLSSDNQRTLSLLRYKLCVPGWVCARACVYPSEQFSVGDEVFLRSVSDLSTETEWEVSIMSETTSGFSLWLHFEIVQQITREDKHPQSPLA